MEKPNPNFRRPQLSHHIPTYRDLPGQQPSDGWEGASAQWKSAIPLCYEIRLLKQAGVRVGVACIGSLGNINDGGPPCQLTCLVPGTTQTEDEDKGIPSGYKGGSGWGIKAEADGDVGTLYCDCGRGAKGNERSFFG
ncbi:unnamed protein product [Linum trigynum]|uniref:Uncharacterized protein n=1 Tax=Linum trigynum TaxID=586398 RepID=A0AAV2ETH7_9ROSI